MSSTQTRTISRRQHHNRGAAPRPSITRLQLARGLRRFEQEMKEGTIQPPAGQDRHTFTADAIFRWLGK